MRRPLTFLAGCLLASSVIVLSTYYLDRWYFPLLDLWEQSADTSPGRGNEMSGGHDERSDYGLPEASS